jgi:NAD kinase
MAQSIDESAENWYYFRSFIIGEKQHIRRKTMKEVLFGGAFNPAGVHHREIARALAAMDMFDRVTVVVCGPRPDKPTTNDIDPVHRAVIADLTFGSLGPKVHVDLSDLELNTFTRTHELDERHSKDGREVWHLVGTDIITGGKDKASLIHRVWTHGPELWEKLNFIVSIRNGIRFDERDLPPKHVLLHIGGDGSSEEIRRAAANHLSLRELVVPAAADYIERNNLYRGGVGAERSRLALTDPRPLFIADEHRPEAVSLAERLRAQYDDGDPNLIVTLGGDGTLLHAIRKHWRLRLPFFPVHLGTYGYLLNDVKGEVDDRFFRGAFTTLRSPMLHIDGMGIDGTNYECLAFNDAWLQIEMGKTGWFGISVNGTTRFPRLMADGVLVATAAGSTAYARAMGAKPIPIGTELLVLAGSNVFDPPHWRNGANLPLGSLIELRNADTSGYRKSYGFADGQALGEISSLAIRTSRIAAPEIAYLHFEEIAEKIIAAQFS